MIGLEFDRFEMDSNGYRGVLRSESVRLDLHARAERIAEQARNMYNDADSIQEVVADSYQGKNRVGATVIAIGSEAERVESERRVLGNAIEFGR